MQVEPAIRLEVHKQDFITELRRAWRVLGRRRPTQAVVGFSDGQLWLRCGGARFEVGAQGHWPGEARVASAVLYAISRVPPPASSLTLSLKDDKLQIGSSVATCYWQAVGSAVIDLALDLDLVELLRLGEQHDDAALEQSGILPEVQAARIRMSRKIATASRALVALGIDDAKLHQWVREQLGLEQLVSARLIKPSLNARR